jgi:hypothetical protein
MYRSKSLILFNSISVFNSTNTNKTNTKQITKRPKQFVHKQAGLIRLRISNSHINFSLDYLRASRKLEAKVTTGTVKVLGVLLSLSA